MWSLLTIPTSPAKKATEISLEKINSILPQIKYISSIRVINNSSLKKYLKGGLSPLRIFISMWITLGLKRNKLLANVYHGVLKYNYVYALKNKNKSKISSSNDFKRAASSIVIQQ